MSRALNWEPKTPLGGAGGNVGSKTGTESVKVKNSKKGRTLGMEGRASCKQEKLWRHGNRCSRCSKAAVWRSCLGLADLLEPFLLLKPGFKMHSDSHGVEASNFHAFKRLTKPNG